MGREFPVVEVFLLRSAIHSSDELKLSQSLFANGGEMTSELHAAYLEQSQLALAWEERLPSESVCALAPPLA